jgi:hypothetical protein
MTPENTKKLMLALRDNLNKFESIHGKIKTLDLSNGIPMNFGGPTTEA